MPTFFDKMIEYNNIIEDTRLPYEQRRAAVLDAYELLREIDDIYQKRGAKEPDPDMRKADYFIHVSLPSWEKKFGLILDGGEPRQRYNGSKSV